MVCERVYKAAGGLLVSLGTVWMMLSVQWEVISRYHIFDWLLRTDLLQRRNVKVLLASSLSQIKVSTGDELGLVVLG